MEAIRVIGIHIHLGAILTGGIVYLENKLTLTLGQTHNSDGYQSDRRKYTSSKQSDRRNILYSSQTSSRYRYKQNSGRI